MEFWRKAGISSREVFVSAIVVTTCGLLCLAIIIAAALIQGGLGR